MIDAAGNGQICFWPLWVGNQRFVLIVKGTPQLNKAALIKLIWKLSIRFGIRASSSRLFSY